MPDSDFATDSFIKIGEDEPVAPTAAGLEDAFALETPTVTLAGFDVSMETTAADFTSTAALRRLVDRFAGLPYGNALTKRVRRMFSRRDPAKAIKFRNYVLFGLTYDGTFSGVVGRVKVEMNAAQWRAELFYTVPYAIPPTALGSTAMYTLDRVVKIEITGLVYVTLDTARGSIYIDSFFYGALRSRVDEARKVAATYGRTLPGMAMEWIRAVAVSVGATEVTLEDAWHGFEGLVSSDLTEAARIWKTTQYLLRRAERTNPDRFNSDSPDYVATYMDRIHRGGYYGQFGFENSYAEVKDLVYVNAPFVDACVATTPTVQNA
jgi:hypothetical protein